MIKILIIGNHNSIYLQNIIEHYTLVFGFDVYRLASAQEHLSGLFNRNSKLVYNYYNLFKRIIDKFIIRSKHQDYSMSTVLKSFDKFDYFDVHYPVLTQYSMLKKINNSGKKINIFIWGSDYKALHESEYPKFEQLLGLADKIIIGGDLFLEEFEQHFASCKEQFILRRFGSKTIDLLRDKEEQFEIIRKRTREKYGIDAGKIVFTLGYSASPQQNHLSIIDALDLLPADKKNKIHLILPLTYPDNTAYIESIKLHLQQTNIEFTTIENFLELDDLIDLRICSNVFVTNQESDGLSSSLIEYAYTKNLLVIADWLAYPEIDAAKMDYFSLSSLEPNDMVLVIDDIIENYERYKLENKTNPQALYDIKSFEATIKEWRSLYRAE